MESELCKLKSEKQKINIRDLELNSYEVCFIDNYLYLYKCNIYYILLLYFFFRKLWMNSHKK